jgi:hypothetical protein
MIYKFNLGGGAIVIPAPDKAEAIKRLVGTQVDIEKVDLQHILPLSTPSWEILNKN